MTAIDLVGRMCIQYSSLWTSNQQSFSSFSNLATSKACFPRRSLPFFCRVCKSSLHSQVINVQHTHIYAYIYTHQTDMQQYQVFHPPPCKASALIRAAHKEQNKHVYVVVCVCVCVCNGCKNIIFFIL